MRLANSFVPERQLVAGVLSILLSGYSQPDGFRRHNRMNWAASGDARIRQIFRTGANMMRISMRRVSAAQWRAEVSAAVVSVS